MTLKAHTIIQWAKRGCGSKGIIVLRTAQQWKPPDIDPGSPVGRRSRLALGAVLDHAIHDAHTEYGEKESKMVHRLISFSMIPATSMETITPARREKLDLMRKVEET